MGIELVFGSILEVEADVMVLSAHPTLIAGGGISGVIHRAAGPGLEQLAKPLGPIKPGSAVMTEGFDLSVSKVIHAVAPRYFDGTIGEIEQLTSTYQSALGLNFKLSSNKTIVFPAIGVGIYRWPSDLASEIAVEQLLESPYARTIVAVTDTANFKAYEAALRIFTQNAN
jgi:O-acetyl-ADP-ribose deacetylase